MLVNVLALYLEKDAAMPIILTRMFCRMPSFS